MTNMASSEDIEELKELLEKEDIKATQEELEKDIEKLYKKFKDEQFTANISGCNWYPLFKMLLKLAEKRIWLLTPSACFGYYSNGLRNHEEICGILDKKKDRVDIKIIIHVCDVITALGAYGLKKAVNDKGEVIHSSEFIPPDNYFLIIDHQCVLEGRSFTKKGLGYTEQTLVRYREGCLLNKDSTVIKNREIEFLRWLDTINKDKDSGDVTSQTDKYLSGWLEFRGKKIVPQPTKITDLLEEITIKTEINEDDLGYEILKLLNNKFKRQK